MKIKLQELYGARLSLDKLFSEDRLTQKMKYRLGFLIKELKELTKNQQEILEKYGAQMKDGQLVLEGNTEEYSKEFQDLLEEEVEIRYTPISLKALEEIKDEEGKEIVKLNAYDYEVLDTFLLHDDTE